MFLLLASGLLKNSITFNVLWSIKLATIIFSIAPWTLANFNNFWHATFKKCDTNVYSSFGHVALRLLLPYLVKCWSRSLTIDNNEFKLGSACISSENYWDHKIIENLLLRLYFKIVSWQTEMIHQWRVGHWSHAVTERAVGKWCQRLLLSFVLQEDILNTCWNDNDVMWLILLLFMAYSSRA